MPLRDSLQQFSVEINESREALLTLLDQGHEGGLQIEQNGEWRDGPLTPGALVVNIGRALQRWTNDVLVATSHRVRMHESLADKAATCVRVRKPCGATATPLDQTVRRRARPQLLRLAPMESATACRVGTESVCSHVLRAQCFPR